MKVTQCAHCFRSIKTHDVRVEVEPGEWVHVTCSKQGVVRWLRANRPYGDPLKWMRMDDPRWQTHQWDNNRAVRGPSDRLIASNR